jgi:rod shape determining protein RodA
LIDLSSRQRADPVLVAVPLILSLAGIVFIGSATGSPASGFVVRQVEAAIIGLGLAVFVARHDYRALTRHSKAVYIANLICLAAVLVLGNESKGAQRWILLGPMTLQPSELAKLALIVTLAALLTKDVAEIDTPGVLWRSLLHMGPPMLLIFKQPDLGTSLVLVAIWFAMTATAGAQLKHLLAVLLIGLCAFGVLWHTDVIKPYQKNRLAILWNPALDSEGETIGYHIRQSRIAIGSGRETGKGLFAGTQKKLRFVPERHTDFIFTVVGEELGFAGSAAVLLLYWILITRGLAVCRTCEDLQGQLMCAGIVAMFTFHTVVNIGMTLGVMPVTGVPLPFLSYGGSSMMTNCVAVGLLLSVHLRRHKIMFT